MIDRIRGYSMKRKVVNGYTQYSIDEFFPALRTTVDSMLKGDTLDLRFNYDDARMFLAHIDALEATIARVRELADKWADVDTEFDPVLAGRRGLAQDLRALLSEGVELTHAYGAAGLLVCGLETGGAISRHDGYRGPDRRSTTHGDRVTCPNCRALLSEGTDDDD